MARDPIKSLEFLEKNIEKRVAGVLNKHAKRIKEKLREDQPLQQRGPRRFPYLSEPAQMEGGKLIAKVYTPVEWAGVHIGPAGSSVTIRPKRGSFLAMPTEFVKDFRGHPVGPRQYGALIFFGGIAWGKVGWGRGDFRRSPFVQRRAAGEIFHKQDLVPLYILKKSIVVRRRIHPEQLVRWVRFGLLADLYKVLKLP